MLLLKVLYRKLLAIIEKNGETSSINLLKLIDYLNWLKVESISLKDACNNLPAYQI